MKISGIGLKQDTFWPRIFLAIKRGQQTEIYGSFSHGLIAFRFFDVTVTIRTLFSESMFPFGDELR